MELDGWVVCEEDILYDMKNAGPHEMTIEKLGTSQGFDPNQGWREEKDFSRVLCGVRTE